MLCEIATSRFRFFEDVDLLLPPELKNELAQLQSTWVDHLLRHRAAVLGAVWRSDDPLGVKCKSEAATVHVFSSSGWSSRITFAFISHIIFIYRQSCTSCRLRTIIPLLQMRNFIIFDV